MGGEVKYKVGESETEPARRVKRRCWIYGCMDEMMEQRSAHERRKVEHKDARWPFYIIYLVHILQLTSSYLSRQIFLPFVCHPDGQRKHIHLGSPSDESHSLILHIPIPAATCPHTRTASPNRITKPNNKIPQHHKLLLVLRFGG